MQNINDFFKWSFVLMSQAKKKEILGHWTLGGD